jgi:hypothetical protein
VQTAPVQTAPARRTSPQTAPLMIPVQATSFIYRRHFSPPVDASKVLLEHLSVENMKNLRLVCRIMREASREPFAEHFRTVSVFVEGGYSHVLGSRYQGEESPNFLKTLRFVEGQSSITQSFNEASGRKSSIEPSEKEDAEDDEEVTAFDETSLRMLLELSKYAELASHVQEIRLVVCRWKLRSLNRDVNGQLVWKYDDFRSMPYTLAEDDFDENQPELRSQVLAELLLKAIPGFKNLHSITLTDTGAHRALGLTMLQRELGLTPNIMLDDYEFSLVHEKVYYEASLLRAFKIVYYALDAVADSPSRPPLHTLSIDSSYMERTFRGLPMRLLNMSQSMADTFQRAFESLSTLNLQINAAQQDIVDASKPQIVSDIGEGKWATKHKTRSYRFFNKILEKCHNLTQLNIEMDGEATTNGYTEFLKFLFEQLTLPLLKDFRLVGHSIPQAAIKSFVIRHAKTLKRLEFGEMRLPHGPHGLNVPDRQTGRGRYWANLLESFLNIPATLPSSPSFPPPSPLSGPPHPRASSTRPPGLSFSEIVANRASKLQAPPPPFDPSIAFPRKRDYEAFSDGLTTITNDGFVTTEVGKSFQAAEKKLTKTTRNRSVFLQPDKRRKTSLFTGRGWKAGAEEEEGSCGLEYLRLWDIVDVADWDGKVVEEVVWEEGLELKGDVGAGIRRELGRLRTL